MKKINQSFLLMLQLLTRIPINRNLPCERENFKIGSAFFPIIGLLIGCIQAVVYLTANIIFSSEISIILSIISGVLVTGALHIDGLGDTCDGFFSLKDRERVIEIMKDSRIGTYACIAIILDIMTRYIGLSALSSDKILYTIISAPVIGRTMIVLISYKGKNAKPNGSGNLFIGNVDLKQLLPAILLCIAIFSFMNGIRTTLIVVISTIIMIFLFRGFCYKKIMGLTGDNLGAANEIAELVTIILSTI